MARIEINIHPSVALADDSATGHNRWHPDVQPVARCSPGDTLVIETRDALDGQVSPDTTIRDLLEVEIVDIEPAPSAIQFSRLASAFCAISSPTMRLPSGSLSAASRPASSCRAFVYRPAPSWALSALRLILPSSSAHMNVRPHRLSEANSAFHRQMRRVLFQGASDPWACGPDRLAKMAATSISARQA
jgi:hypothetical protein